MLRHALLLFTVLRCVQSGPQAGRSHGWTDRPPPRRLGRLTRLIIAFIHSNPQALISQIPNSPLPNYLRIIMYARHLKNFSRSTTFVITSAIMLCVDTKSMW